MATAIPSDFICHISHELMEDPVVTVDGETYERHAIQNWFESGHTTSPLTNCSLSSTTLIPNRSLKRAIQNFQELQVQQNTTLKDLEEIVAQQDVQLQKVGDLEEIVAQFQTRDERNDSALIDYQCVLKEARMIYELRPAAPPDLVMPLARHCEYPGNPRLLSEIEKIGNDQVFAIARCFENSREQEAEAMQALTKQHDDYKIAMETLDVEIVEQEGEAAKAWQRIQELDAALVLKSIDCEACGLEFLSVANSIDVDLCDALRLYVRIGLEPATCTNGTVTQKYSTSWREYKFLQTQRDREWKAYRCAVQRTFAAKAEAAATRAQFETVLLSMQEATKTFQQTDKNKRIANAILECLTHDCDVSRHFARRFMLAAIHAVEIEASDYDIVSVWCNVVKKVSNVFSVALFRALEFPGFALKVAGFPLEELTIAGFRASQLKVAGFTLEELKAAGFTIDELKAVGCTLEELKAAGCTASELKAAGCTLEELKAAGFTTSELKVAGFTLEESKAAGATIDELKVAGFTLEELKAAGCTASELKAVGCTLEELNAAGFTTSELKAVGVTASELKAVGVSAGELFPLCRHKSSGWEVGQKLIAANKYGEVTHMESRGNSRYIKIVYEDGSRNTIDVANHHAVVELHFA